MIRALLALDASAASETDCEGSLPLHHALSYFPAAEDQGSPLAPGTLVRPSSLAPHNLSLGPAREQTLEPFGGTLGIVVKYSPHKRESYLVSPLGALENFAWYQRQELVQGDGVPADPEVVAFLVESFPDSLRQPDGCGRLPLHLAAGGACSASLLESLLSAGQPEDAARRDDKGLYPLHYAALERAPISKVKALLQAPGLDLTAGNFASRHTALHWACRHGAPSECILAILQACPSAAGLFTLQRTLPLHFAAGLPPSVVGALLRAYPSAVRERTVDGQLPLHCLVSSPAADLDSIALVLGEWQAAIAEKTEAGNTALLLACEFQAALPVIKALHAAHPGAMREKNEQGCFPAHLAVRYVHAPVQPALVAFLAAENKITFKERDSTGRTPLHCAVSSVDSELSVVNAVAAVLKEAIAMPDNKGNLPLHLACSSGLHPDILAILNRDGSVSRVNDDGELPLHRFLGGNSGTAGVRYLLAAYENALFTPNSAGQLPLHCACKAGVGLDIVQCLLEAHPGGASVLSDDLQSPLHLAAKSQAPASVLELLLATFPGGARAAAAAKTKQDGYLPLHFACANETRVQYEDIKVLLDAFPDGAKVLTKQKHKSPLYLAAAGAPARVLDMLIKANPEALQLKELEASFTPLHLAVFKAKSSNTESIATLVAAWKEGAAVSSSSEDLPLHFVRSGTSAATAEVLLRANPSAREAVNDEGRLPLHRASYNAAAKNVVSLLLSEAAAKTQDKAKMLPLHCACTENLLEVVVLLLDTFPQGIEHQDRNNVAPLGTACESSYKGDIIKLLVQRYPRAASIAALNGTKEFPLFRAVNSRFVPPDVVEVLHNAAESVASSVIASDFTLLHYATWGKVPVDTLAQIIKLAPKSPSQEDRYKRLPLHFGASSKAAMELLISASPPDALRTKNIDGSTPLSFFLSFWDPKLDAFEAMLNKDKGAAAELDNDDASPLAIACGLTRKEEKDRKPSKLAVISALLDAYPGATLLKVKSTSYLPLHVACKYKASADVIGALLAKGRGTEKALTKDLSLPLHLALDAGAPHTSSTALLKAYPAAAKIADAKGRLPLHLALASTSGNVPESLVREIFSLHPAAARARNNEDHEPLMCLQQRILKSGSSGAYSGELLGQIMLQCLPFDPLTGEAHAAGAEAGGDAPCYVWHAVLADCEDKLVQGVQEVLRAIPERVEALAFALDDHGRRAIDRATPLCKAAIIQRLFLCGRFEFKAGPPEHVSATSIVRFATDYAKEAVPSGLAVSKEEGSAGSSGSGGGASPAPAAAAAAAAAAATLPTVCLKFLKHRENFQRELSARQCAVHGPTSPEYVVPILCAFDGMSDEGFAEELKSRGLHSHPFLLVFPAGDRPLSAIIDHERETKEWGEEVRGAAASLSAGLAHLHSRGVIHGDVKPRNVVRLGRHYRLIDLDASCRFGEEVGIKTSTALAPPELLHMGPTGRVLVRACLPGSSGSGGEGGSEAASLAAAAAAAAPTPLPAHPSFDMWMLGATLYHMLTGATLLHATNSDNAADEAQLQLAAEWAPGDKAAKLRLVEPPRARHLLSLLLSRSPAQRPTAERVAQHPYITGRQAVRVSGESPHYDVFISYRVASDAAVAQELYDLLCAKGCRVWWDRRCLALGRDWREGFCGGLATSRAFVALLSREGFAARDTAGGGAVAGRNWGSHCLTRASPCDNVLLEHRLALELAHSERGLLELIIPVFVGDCSEAEPSMHSPWAASCAPVPGEESCAAVDEELAAQLDKQGLGTPFDSAMGTAAVWRAIGGKQGQFVSGQRSAALEAVAEGIVKALQAPKAAEADALAGAAAAAALAEGEGAAPGGSAAPGLAPAPTPGAPHLTPAAAQLAAVNAELSLALKAVREEAQGLRGRVELALPLEARVAALQAEAAAAQAEAQSLKGRLQRAEAAAAAAAATATAAAAAAATPAAALPLPAAEAPALAAALEEARGLLDRGARESEELRRSLGQARAEEERLRAALAAAAAAPAVSAVQPLSPPGREALASRLASAESALAESSAREASLQEALAASTAHAASLQAAAASPAPAWKAVLDASSGQVYYYHSETGDTSWESPSGEGGAALAPSVPGAAAAGGSWRAGGGAGLEQAVSQQQALSAQLQGQLMMQGQVILGLQREVSQGGAMLLSSGTPCPQTPCSSLNTLNHPLPSLLQMMELRSSLHK